jgi:hypothetical protein
MKWLTTGGEDGQPHADREEPAEVRSGAQHPLAVVQDEQEPLWRQHGGHGLDQRVTGDIPHTERGGDRRHHQFGIVQR